MQFEGVWVKRESTVDEFNSVFSAVSSGDVVPGVVSSLRALTSIVFKGGSSFDVIW